ncbi:MAG: NUDIX domain-containing protein [Verrucomicrobia bacterium]|nr:NUDIX domain-containing protein [Verrucomicrobiota bacterium]
MINEESFGIIPLQAATDGWMVFLIQHRGANHWGFPKGKGNPGEKPLESASRELFEETGLNVEKILQQEPFSEEYAFTRRGKVVNKKVFYFPAVVFGELNLQENEIQDGKWVPLEEAEAHVTFEESKKICKKLVFFLLSS